jgi:hypothetical protein
MSLRFPAGYIGKTDITPTGSAFSDAAPGVWTITEALYWKNLGLWPTFGPTAGFDFVDSTSAFDSRITYTGASARMYFDSTGTLRYAPMNLLTYSEQFDNAAWTKTRSSVTDNTTTAPNGTMTGDTLIPNTDNNTHFIQSSVISFTSGTSYSYTCFVKAAGYSFLRLAFGATAFPSDNRGACFDLSTGAVGATQAGVTASITSAGNGWFRCSISRAATATANDVVFIESKSQDLATPQTFIGDGTSGAFLWGAMLNLGPTAFDYIPTTTAAVYLPRSNAYQDHDPATLAPLGFLIEEQRTNLLLQSADFTTTWVPIAATVTANTINAPTGTPIADSLLETTATGEHFVRQLLTGLAANTTYTTSIFVKSIEGRNVRIRILDTDNVSNGYLAGVNLTTGAVNTAALNVGAGTGATVTVQALQDGWYRIALSGNAGATCTKYTVDFFSISGTTITFAGDITKGLYLFGAQTEIGAFATSPILTTGAAATRLADVASITGTNFSSFWNQAEGTVVANAIPTLSGTRVFYAANDATNNEAINLYWSTTLQGQIRDGGVTQALISAAISNPLKTAFAYKADDAALAANGDLLGTDTALTLPTTTQLGIGNQISSNYLNGHIQSLTYFNRRLPNQTLQSLTV